MQNGSQRRWNHGYLKQKLSGRQMVRDSNPGHQKLLPPADSCPHIFVLDHAVDAGVELIELPVLVGDRAPTAVREL